MGSSKFEVDMIHAIELRTEVIFNLNQYFGSNLKTYHIHFAHELQEIHKPSEKARNNTLLNRLSDSSIHKSMGLDCILMNYMTGVTMLVMIRFTDDANCFVKATSDDLKQDYRYFINTLIKEKNAHFLYVAKKGGKVTTNYSNLIPLACAGRGIRDASTGNTNRIIFPKIIPAKMMYKGIDDGDLFGGEYNLMTQINELL